MKVLKHIARAAAPVLVLLAGFGVVQAMIAAKPAPEKKESTQRLVSLYVDEVRRDAVVLRVDAHGEARPRTEIDLVPDVAGRIVAIADAFAAGAAFDEGTVLVKIDDADYRLRVTQAEARVAEAERQLAQEEAAAQIKRQQWERTRATAAPTPLQINQPQIAEAVARLAAARAEFAAARLDLERTEIRLPFRGRVRSRAVGVGQYVSVGTTLGRVFSTDAIEVTLPLTDAQLAQLELPIGYVAERGAGPVVTLTAEVGGEPQRWRGRIVRTHAAVDEGTRLIHAVAEVADPYGAGASDRGVPLAVGLFVGAEIAGTRPVEGLVMPRDALRNGDQVYVVNDEDRLEIRRVDVLWSNEEQVLVASGVAAGERVVTSTLANATAGMVVQPITRLAQL